MDVSTVHANVNSAISAPDRKIRAGESGVNMALRGNGLPEEGQSFITKALSGDVASNEATGAKAEEASDSPVDMGALQANVDKANEAMSMRLSNLQFTVAEGTDIPVVRIEDAETGELIRQIPSEEMVALSKALEDLQQGMLLEEKA